MLSNLWHPNSNPEGFVSLGVAENALMHNELREFINSKKLVDERSKALTYGDGPSGSIPLRRALATFFNDHFNPVKPVHADHLMVTNGCTTAIEHCSWTLAGPGEGILLGRPYYRAFLPDISLRTGVKVVPVSFGAIDPLSPDCVAKYEEALLASNKRGVQVRALMLCHPHNPLGRCYPRETLLGLMKLCQKYSIHLVSDEIYALSVWDNTVDELDQKPAGFESVMSINTDAIIDAGLVHVLWGMSKDFGANGLRIGVIISQHNDDFLMACRTCSLYSSPSALSENAVVSLLGDKTFLDNYIITNKIRLSEAYAFAVKLLESQGIPHQKGVNATFFLWINLGKKYLARNPKLVDSKSTSSITEEIFQKLMKNKIFLVHGGAAGAEEPGWFRLVFTQPQDMLEEGIKRISQAIG